MERVFSVVIPSYNGGEIWKSAVNSVLKQDYPWIELVFADDGTPDFDINTVKIYIEEHKKKNLVNYIVIQQKNNVGTVQNFRNAHQHCRGHYLTHIAMDDVYCDEHVLSRYAQALDNKPEDVLGVYARSLVCDEQLNPLGNVSFDIKKAQRMNDVTSIEQFNEMAKYCCIHMGATAFLREEFMETGDFDSGYRLMEDWPFFLQATLSGKRFEYHAFDGIFYRNGGVTDAAYSTAPRKAFREDHLRMYERILFPNLKLLKLGTGILVCGRYEESRIVIEHHYGPMAKIGLKMRIVCKFAYVCTFIQDRKKFFILWTIGMFAISALELGVPMMIAYTGALIVIKKLRKYLKHLKR